MKKTFIKILATAATVLLLASCGSGNSKFVFTDDNLKAQGADKDVDFSYNSHITISDTSMNTTVFGSGDSVESNGEFSVNGVKIGDSYEKFADSFSLVNGKAMWETCLYVTEGEILFDYPVYSGSKIDFDSYDDVFLTVGYYTDNSDNEKKQWELLDYELLKNAWNLELSDSESAQIGNICFLSAGIDSNGNINMLDVYYGSFSDFAENEDYEVNIDYFANTQETPVEE